MAQTNTARFVPSNTYQGGALAGYVTLSYKELVKVFGKPQGRTDEYKVSTSWEIRDTETGVSFEIYDYKETKLYSEDLPSVTAFRRLPSYRWHLGGGGIDMIALSAFLSEKLGRNVLVSTGYF